MDEKVPARKMKMMFPGPELTPSIRLLLVGLAFGMGMPPADSARILLLPVPTLSHVSEFAYMSEPLVDRGHEVFAVMNGACRKACKSLENFGVSIIPFYTPGKECVSEQRMDAVNEHTLHRGDVDGVMNNLTRDLLTEAEFMLGDYSYFQALKALNLDLCIVDGMGHTLFNYILPYKLDVEHITLTTSFFGTWANVPSLPSFTPYLYSAVSDRMSFLERVHNTINSIKGPFLLTMVKGSRDHLIRRYAPEKPSVSFITLQRRSKLWLVATDPALDYPRVTLPHVINVGGLTTRERKQLPEDLSKLLKQSRTAVLVSFGSIVSFLPMNFTKKLIDAFRQIDDVTFIFKYDGPKLDEVPKNVHLCRWLPQNDLLGHPSVRLFITHCGNNGQFEALYHAVPMIGLPLFGDQFYGAKRMEVKGFGIAMDAYNSSVESLVHNIREVLSNESYEIAIDHASQVFQDRQELPKERAAFWIEHIMRFGAGHLISAAVEMPWYQFWLIDVIALFLSIISAIVLVATLLICGLVRALNNNTNTPKHKKD